MIISSNTDKNLVAMWNFLRMMGVFLPQSNDFQAIARIGSDQRIMGVVAFNGFNGMTACMHTAGIGNWVSRNLITQAFHYPFVQCRLNHLFATVPADNKKALRFDRKMGFKDWGPVIPNGHDNGVDLIVLKMAREECRWLVPFAQRKAA